MLPRSLTTIQLHPTSGEVLHEGTLPDEALANEALADITLVNDRGWKSTDVPSLPAANLIHLGVPDVVLVFSTALCNFPSMLLVDPGIRRGGFYHTHFPKTTPLMTHLRGGAHKFGMTAQLI